MQIYNSNFAIRNYDLLFINTKMLTMETLGDRVKAIRQRAGLSQLEFAEKIGLAGPTISLIEKKGTASQETVEAICKSYKIDKAWLLTGEGESPKGVIVVPIRKELGESPWKDATYQQMREEITFLKQLVNNLTLAKGKENFLNAPTEAGSHIGKYNALELPFPTGEQMGARA